MDMLSLIDFPHAIANIKKLDGYGSENYEVMLNNGDTVLVKLYEKQNAQKVLEEERIIAEISKSLPFELPNKIDIPLRQSQQDVYIRITQFMNGAALTRNQVTDSLLAEIASSAGSLLTALEKTSSNFIKAHEHDWNLRDALRNRKKTSYITSASNRKLVQHYFSKFEYEVVPAFDRIRMGIIHGDLNEANIIVHEGKLKGFIDFGDISYAPLIGELAVLLTYIMLFFPDSCMEKAKIIIQHFQQQFPFTRDEIQLLPTLIATRLCVSVCNSAEATFAGKQTDYILISEKPAWHLLHQWVSYNPVFLENSFLSFAGFSSEIPNTQALLQRRKKVAAPGLSLSYSEPIAMSAALFQYMYDTEGGTYLDAYNNIPHIGHSHPAVIEAATRQMRLLNTNTRYLYNSYVEFSENLLSLFPTHINKALLVNSGSEASDLATRIARTVSGRKSVAVMEWGYHGNTQNGINISSYKFDRKGGSGAEDTILRLPLPKAYRGKFDSAQAYFNEARQLIENFEQQGKQLAAFITEPISGCGGQVPLMDGYLALLVPYLRSKGVIIIMDEVQTGFGRMGECFWGFEMHGILPDMVVLGKPIGNGHPMGAVVTTEAITNAFNNGMEFFSSFGGNPVSCAIGNAVIKTIQEEELQQNASATGKYWFQELRNLQKAFPLLGDVRGAGLFVGVECINEAGKENTSLAQYIKNALKKEYILSSTDGPLDNTLKMKPPICFGKSDVDRFMEALNKVLKAYHW